ncbi:hypothetical protein ZHAS_00007732 [Anopheles sinensis]|uniref:Uncharacterized protein n=1 Tax=Anopheles sinensis TaxID=74873 RepID=A0A084VQL6_ANOSI|nr:hypothetical protein ZHAS_00007732 [Anopheles sinensis]
MIEIERQNVIGVTGVGEARVGWWSGGGAKIFEMMTPGLDEERTAKEVNDGKMVKLSSNVAVEFVLALR